MRVNLITAIAIYMSMISLAGCRRPPRVDDEYRKALTEMGGTHWEDPRKDYEYQLTLNLTVTSTEFVPNTSKISFVPKPVNSVKSDFLVTIKSISQVLLTYTIADPLLAESEGEEAELDSNTMIAYAPIMPGCNLEIEATSERRRGTKPAVIPLDEYLLDACERRPDVPACKSAIQELRPKKTKPRL